MPPQIGTVLSFLFQSEWPLFLTRCCNSWDFQDDVEEDNMIIHPCLPNLVGENVVFIH